MTETGAAGSQNTPTTQTVNGTFRAMVLDSNDLVGLIAYSLYKADKATFISSYLSDHGASPDDSQISAFVRTVNMPSQIEAYRNRATDLLETMYDELLESAIVDLKAESQVQMIDELKKFRGFWKAVRENVVANLIAAAIAVILVLLVYGSRINIIPIIGDMFGYEVREKADK